MYDEDGLLETRKYDEANDLLIVTTTYDSSRTIEANKAARAATPETGRFKTSNNGLVHALSMEWGDILRLRNMGYDLLSPDKEEFRRALIYIQTSEPWHMPIKGKVFTQKRTRWV